MLFIMARALPKATILKVDAKYPAVHFPSLYCYPIFLITKTKYIWVYDYSFCCWDACRNIQVQEKSVYFFEVHNFEDKRSLVDIDQLPNMSFQFFIEWTQFFLFIGPESDHCLPLSLTHSLTDWLTDSLLFSKLD